MSLKDFKIIAKLGEGAYSIVYKVKRIEDHQQYALKKVNLNNIQERDKYNALNEVRILASIQHDNIISYKEAFIDTNSNSLCIVMELATDGDLLQRIHKYQKANNSFQESEIIYYAFQLLSALMTLHEMKIFHRDIKSANIFVINNQVKLGDMNVSKVAKQGLLYTQTGTPYYASPEVWKDQPYDCKSDIWSLGCVLYEMATHQLPFQAESMDGLFKRVVKGFYQKLPSFYSQELSNLIRMMLQVQTNLRPTAQYLLEQPIFSKYKLYSSQSEQKLLNTIEFPKNKIICNNIFPKPTYKSKTEQTENYNLEQIQRKRQATIGGNHTLLSNNTRFSQHEDVQMHINSRLDLNNSKSNRHSLVKLLSEGSQQKLNGKMKLNQQKTTKQKRKIIIPVLIENQSPILCKKSPRLNNQNHNALLPLIM